MKNKLLIIVACAIGLIAVFYGMSKDNNIIFIIGIVIIIGAYLVIRKRLKASIRDKE